MYRTIMETKLFKDIFPSYENFQNWYRNTPLSSSDECPNEKTFSLIAYEYNDSHSAFLTEENFKEHFAIDLYTYFKEFEATTAAIDKLMSLSDDDVAMDGQMITNIASIPETASSTDVEQVDFITQQQKMINKKGKQTITREQLANKRSYTTRTFLKRFKHLFIKVFDTPYTRVIEEENH